MLETKDLIIKKGEFSDWKDMYYNLWRHSESARYMLWNVTTSEEAAKARMERTIAFEESHEYEWLVYEKASNQAIGFAGMIEIEENVYEDTGIAIGPEFVRRGYGKQILNALTDYARDELGATKFVVSCRTKNIASHNLQMSCGFQFSHYEGRVDPRNGEEYTLEFNYKDL